MEMCLATTHSGATTSANATATSSPSTACRWPCERGECFGLLGPNGAGKTTTIEILEGLLPPDAGDVEVLGMAWRTHERELRQRLGVQLQETQLPDKLTVEETLRLFRSFYHRGRTVDELLRMVELEAKRASWVGQAVGRAEAAARAGVRAGRRARPAVPRRTDHRARSAVAPPAVGSGSPRSATRGGTVLLTTHYMDEAEILCDRVAIVDHGRVIALGTPQELIASLGTAEGRHPARHPRGRVHGADRDGTCAMNDLLR